MAGAAVPAIGNFLLAVFGGTSAAATAAAYFAAEVFAYAATSYLIGRASAALAPKPKANAGLPGGMEANYFDTNASVRIIYGRVKVGGMETIPPLTNSKPNSNAFEDLHKVLTIAGHEINSYEYTHFDATTIVNAQIGPVAYTMSDGLVNSGTFKDLAFIRRALGTSTDSADRILVSNNATAFSNARARGIAKARLTFRYDADVYKGIPTVTFTLQGKKCYDPRLDSSPGAAPTNPSFIVWTNNNALCTTDYLTSFLGGEYDTADIDWDTVVTAANACDALVAIPNSLTQKRYTCNGVLLATDDFLDNVKMLVDSMLGRVMFRDGKWRIFAGGWQTPTFTIAKSDWVSPMGARFEQGSKKRFNQMRVWYVDPNREWQKNECTPRINSTYRTADGGRTIEAETEQPTCTDEFEAQRKGEFLLRQSRNQVAPTGQLGPKHGNIALWDTGTIVDDELGWSSKTFRVVAIDRAQDGGADYVFNEEQSTDWTDLTGAEYNQPSNAAMPANNVTTPTEPTSLSALPQVNGTIMFTWDTPIVKPPGTRFRIVRSTNSADASVGTVVWDGLASPVPLVMPTSQHFYYVYALTGSGAKSPFQPNTFGVAATARLEADQTLQNRLCGDAEFEYGDTTSLWDTRPQINVGNIIFAQENIAGGARAQNFRLSQETAQSSVYQFTYVASGGQYGGYMNVRHHPTQADTSGYECFMRGANPLLPGSGHAYSGEPFGIEYQARVRINTPGAAGGFELMFGAAIFADAPSSIGMRQLTAQYIVSSTAALRQGEWGTVRGFGVVLPMAVATAVGTTEPSVVRSATGFYVHPALAFLAITGSQGNYDVDFFQATNVGFLNEPRHSLLIQQAGAVRNVQLFEFFSMYGLVLNVFSGTAITFPSSDVYRWSDWRQWQMGRKFVLNKANLSVSAFLCPASGMTLRLAGRSATGTVTFVTSLPGFATVEKTADAEFTVNGSPLGVI